MEMIINKSPNNARKKVSITEVFNQFCGYYPKGFMQRQHTESRRLSDILPVITHPQKLDAGQCKSRAFIPFLCSEGAITPHFSVWRNPKTGKSFTKKQYFVNKDKWCEVKSLSDKLEECFKSRKNSRQAGLFLYEGYNRNKGIPNRYLDVDAVQSLAHLAKTTGEGKLAYLIIKAALPSFSSPGRCFIIEFDNLSESTITALFNHYADDARTVICSRSLSGCGLWVMFASDKFLLKSQLMAFAAQEESRLIAAGIVFRGLDEGTVEQPIDRAAFNNVRVIGFPTNAFIQSGDVELVVFDEMTRTAASVTDEPNPSSYNQFGANSAVADGATVENGTALFEQVCNEMTAERRRAQGLKESWLQSIESYIRDKAKYTKCDDANSVIYPASLRIGNLVAYGLISEPEAFAFIDTVARNAGVCRPRKACIVGGINTGIRNAKAGKCPFSQAWRGKSGRAAKPLYTFPEYRHLFKLVKKYVSFTGDDEITMAALIDFIEDDARQTHLGRLYIEDKKSTLARDLGKMFRAVGVTSCRRSRKKIYHYDVSPFQNEKWCEVQLQAMCCPDADDEVAQDIECRKVELGGRVYKNIKTEQFEHVEDIRAKGTEITPITTDRQFNKLAPHGFPANACVHKDRSRMFCRSRQVGLYYEPHGKAYQYSQGAQDELYAELVKVSNVAALSPKERAVYDETLKQFRDNLAMLVYKIFRHKCVDNFATIWRLLTSGLHHPPQKATKILWLLWCPGIAPKLPRMVSRHRHRGEDRKVEIRRDLRVF